MTDSEPVIEAACQAFFANTWDTMPDEVKDIVRPQMARAVVAAIETSKNFHPRAGTQIDDDTFAWPCGCRIVHNYPAQRYDVRACTPEHDELLEAFVRAHVADVLPGAVFERVDPGLN